MPTVNAIVTRGGTWRLVDSAVVQRAGSSAWVVMLSDYHGFHRGEAQNGAPSAWYAVNEHWACCWSLQTGTIGNIHTSWILYWDNHNHTHTDSSNVHLICAPFPPHSGAKGAPAQRACKTSSCTLNTHLMVTLKSYFLNLANLTLNIIYAVM